MSKRSIFEEVGEAGAGPATTAGVIDRGRSEARGSIRLWLMLLFVLVFVMIAVGGLTRLTDSGLSITEWRPFSGAIPPLSQADWEAEFALYQQIDEFKIQNSWMSLADFKVIYWWEWGHRQLGRVIGLVWFVGFLWFLLRGRIPPGRAGLWQPILGFAGFGALIGAEIALRQGSIDGLLARQIELGAFGFMALMAVLGLTARSMDWTGKLLFLGFLGGLQGAIGWWMVASGVTSGEGMLDVASYRLATHLGLAFIILGLIRLARLQPCPPATRLDAGPPRPRCQALWHGHRAVALCFPPDPSWRACCRDRCRAQLYRLAPDGRAGLSPERLRA